MGAQYVDGPGAFIGPRWQHANGISVALHAVYEWTHDGTDGFSQDGGQHDAAPIHVPGHHDHNRGGVAVMLSLPLGGK
jgi:hypothetical protein